MLNRYHVMMIATSGHTFNFDNVFGEPCKAGDRFILHPKAHNKNLAIKAASQIARLAGVRADVAGVVIWEKGGRQ